MGRPVRRPSRGLSHDRSPRRDMTFKGSSYRLKQHPIGLAALDETTKWVE